MKVEVIWGYRRGGGSMASHNERVDFAFLLPLKVAHITAFEFLPEKSTIYFDITSKGIWCYHREADQW